MTFRQSDYIVLTLLYDYGAGTKVLFFVRLDPRLGPRGVGKRRVGNRDGKETAGDVLQITLNTAAQGKDG